MFLGAAMAFISTPLAPLLKAWCVKAKVLPEVSAISVSHCRKTWKLTFTYTASQPLIHQKIVDIAMNGVGCRANAHIMGIDLNTIFRHLENSGSSQ